MTDEVVLTVCRLDNAVQMVITTSSPPAGGASPSLGKPERETDSHTSVRHWFGMTLCFRLRKDAVLFLPLASFSLPFAAESFFSAALALFLLLYFQYDDQHRDKQQKNYRGYNDDS